MTVTQWLVIATIVFLSLVDLWLLERRGKDATISQTLLRWSKPVSRHRVRDRVCDGTYFLEQLPMNSMRLGGGGRFQALEQKLAQEPGVRNPGGLAAAIGRRIYGSQKMAAMAKAGENRGK